MVRRSGAQTRKQPSPWPGALRSGRGRGGSGATTLTGHSDGDRVQTEIGVIVVTCKWNGLLLIGAPDAVRDPERQRDEGGSQRPVQAPS